MNPIIMHGVLAIDTDGIGDHYGDKTAQNQTSAKKDKDGKLVPASDSNGIEYLDAGKDNYAVAPKNIAGLVKIGDTATVNFLGGKSYSMPVGDYGPSGKAGEFSLCAVKKMGVDILFTHAGPIPTIDGPSASDIHVIVQFFPGSAR